MWGNWDFSASSSFVPSYIEDLQCPFNIPAQVIDTSNSYVLPDFYNTQGLSFVSSGDFDVKIRAFDDVGFFGCINLKFTMKRKV